MRAWNYKTMHIFFDKVGVDIHSIQYTPPIQIHFGFQKYIPRTYPPIETLQIMWWLFFTDYSLESVPQSYKYYLLELETDHVSQSVFEMCAARHIVLK